MDETLDINTPIFFLTGPAGIFTVPGCMCAHVWAADDGVGRLVAAPRAAGAAQRGFQLPSAPPGSSGDGDAICPAPAERSPLPGAGKAGTRSWAFASRLRRAWMQTAARYL